ncbi:hypothetical protein BD560DRAFT_335785 [Blakeslea trispora]|nr:hypothetical protein BD560DRAFT_335785 [Blakeslea trispora]
MKRPRAPIACYRCHHKKVRCDGVHPNCTRCLSTGVLCAYPSSRRSRNTQPANVDPFIDNLSQLEARIRQIETDIESLRAFAHGSVNDTETLACQIIKTENDLQESRSIIAQLRLKGEQRVARGRRAAAAAAAAATVNSAPYITSTNMLSTTPSVMGSSPKNDFKPASISCSMKAKGKLKISSAKKNPKSPSYLTTPTDTTKATTSSPTYQYPLYFTSANDFIHPYFPHALATSTYPVPEALQSWPLMNDVSQNTGSLPDQNQEQALNELVDPMIIAAAIEAQQQQQQQQNNASLLSIPTCMNHEQKRVHTLSHASVHDNSMFVAGLQPSSTTSSSSFDYGQPFYASFMENSSI